MLVVESKPKLEHELDPVKTEVRIPEKIYLLRISKTTAQPYWTMSTNVSSYHTRVKRTPALYKILEVWR